MRGKSHLDILEGDTFLHSEHQTGKEKRNYSCEILIYSFSPTENVVHSSKANRSVL